MSRIVLFGATGYTGRLVAQALAESGERPLLAGRDQDRLERLAATLGGLESAVAGADERLRSLLDPGDVLVTTVGPFLQHGQAALDAAIGSAAAYLDSSGEPPFVRRVFAEAGPRAAGRSALLTAFGYDFVPGNLAGALALTEAGPTATRVDIGYFLTGSSGANPASTGTIASAAGLLGAPGFAWRGGRIVTVRNAASVRVFTVDGRRKEAISVSGSEHFALPRLAPGLREVSTSIGWFGPASRIVGVGSALTARLPGVAWAARSLSSRLARRTGEGPDPSSRATSGTAVVAVAADDRGGILAEVHLAGPNGYDFTGRILAWGARNAAAITATGALGPVDAFGLEALQAGCAEAGLVRV